MRVRQTIAAFDVFLEARGLRLEAVVVGGAALGLLGIVARETKDRDVLHPVLPDTIGEAAGAFAAAERTAGRVLRDDWLNNGPSSLTSVLPVGWQERLQIAYSGTAIELRCLGRPDLLKSKLFALCDRALDLLDCVALAPTADELLEALPWLEHQDSNPDWPEHVLETIADLGRRLGHGL